MNQERIVALLEEVKNGTVEVSHALEQLRALPYQDLGFAKVDHHRAHRHGTPEVIFCQGKTPDQVCRIAQALAGAGQAVLATRASREHFDALEGVLPDLVYFEDARVIGPRALEDEERGQGLVMVVSAGTADQPVAREALLTARACGSRALGVFDVGVAGLHRLLDKVEQLQQARALVVVAGMEGALPSVVGGLVAAPVVAVPTSVGYGASLGGIAALLGMLNSCASNVTVVNIDNGFGAGYVASMINRQPALLRAE